MFGLTAVAIDFSHAPVSYNSANIILMWDTIEHLMRPDLVVRKAVDVLQTGGSLFLTAGDIGSLLARIRGYKQRLIHPPTHLHDFNKETITKLLENAGLEVVEIKYVPVWRSDRQIIYSFLVLDKQKLLSSTAGSKTHGLVRSPFL